MNFVLYIALLSVSATPAFEAQTLDGPPVSGQIIRLDAKQLAMELPTGRTTFAIEKVLSLSAKRKLSDASPEPTLWVDLVDGSHLAAEEYTVREGKSRILLTNGDTLELPVRSIATVRLQSGSPAMAAQWSHLIDTKPQNDLLVTSKGDSMDYHKGVIHDVTDRQVRFDLDGDVLNVKRAKIYGLIYYHAGDKATESPYSVLDATGSRWSAQSVTLAGKLEWTTPDGRTMQRDLEHIHQIDLSRGKIVYLSDLQPDGSVYTPFFGMERESTARAQFFRPRQDQNLESQPLRTGVKLFSKGLALHSRTEMTYSLPGSFSRFEAVAGIDDGVRPRGNVRLVIRGDGKVLSETVVAGADAPKPITVDVSGVRRLVILADFGDDMDIADHLDLGNARLVK